MAIKSKLTGLGVAPAAAAAIAGTVANSLTATGSTQATALLLSQDDIQIVTTTASSTGVILLPGVSTTAANPYSAGDCVTIANYGAQTLTVYPPTGGKIANGSANSGVSVSANKTGVFTCIDSINWTAGIGA